jgi:hypothetical protein
MKNFSKNLVAAIVVSLLAIGLYAQQAAPAARPAQTAPAAQQAQPDAAPQPQSLPGEPIDGSLFVLDLGTVAGYSLDSNGPVLGRYFGLSILVANNLAVGFANTSAAAITYNLFRLGYAITPLVGLDMYVGSSNNPPATGSTAGGLGAFVNLKRDRTDAGIFTALKLRVQYLTDVTAGLTSGNVVMAVSASVGI